MDKFKGQSVEDVLRLKIQRGQYLDDGDSGAKPPRRGDGGGGGDKGPGGSEEESFGGMMDEALQAVATLGFISVYVYILNGQELVRLAKSYIRYLFTGKQSVRLKRAMSKWGEYYLYITEKQRVDKYCLEKAILKTPTWWNDPEDYRVVVLNYFPAKSAE